MYGNNFYDTNTRFPKIKLNNIYADSSFTTLQPKILLRHQYKKISQAPKSTKKQTFFNKNTLFQKILHIFGARNDLDTKNLSKAF